MSFFPAGSFEADASQIEILLDIREQGMEAFADVRKKNEELIGLMTVLVAATERVASSSEEASRAAEEEAGALKEVKKQAAEASVALGAFAVVNKGIGGALSWIWNLLTIPTGWAQVILTGLVILFGPLLAFGSVLLISTSVMAAWIVGATSMVVLLGGLAAGFAAIGAAIIALGVAGIGTGSPGSSAAQVASANAGITAAQQRVFDAQQAIVDLQERVAAQKSHTPTLAQHQQMEDLLLREARAQDALNAAQAKAGGLIAATTTSVDVFKSHWEDMVSGLEQASVPIAQMALNFADKLLPLISDQGEQVINWFGARMPAALTQISRVITDLTPVFDSFAAFMAGMFDRFSPEFGARFEDAVNAVLPILRNFIDALASVTVWFEKRLPVFGPIVSAIFDSIGHATEAVASVWGKFADWGASRFWPLLKSIQDEWNKPGVGSGLMEQLKKDLPDILNNLDTWVKNSPKWIPAITDVAGAILWLTARTTDLFTWLGSLIDRMTAWANNNDFWAGLQKHILDFATWIGGIAQTIGQFLATIPVDQPPSGATGGTGLNSRGAAGGGTGGGGGTSHDGTAADAKAAWAAQQTLSNWLAKLLTGHGFAHGGTVPGRPGQEMIIKAHGGETVISEGGTSDIIGLLKAILDELRTQPETSRTGVEAALYKAVSGASLNRARGMPGA